MATAPAPIIDSLPPSRGADHAERDALLAENRRLRELVAKLSEIVVRNVLDRGSPASPPLRVKRG